MVGDGELAKISATGVLPVEPGPSGFEGGEYELHEGRGNVLAKGRIVGNIQFQALDV